MGTLRRLQPVAAALLLAFLLNACAATQRTIFWHHKAVQGSNTALKSATLDDLNAIISRTYDGIHSFQASVNLAASSGSIYQAHIVDYPSLKGYIFFSKPDEIRVRASLPIVGLAFDMVSNGASFRLNRENKEFITGLNSAPAHSANKIENLRPQAFLSSMLIRPWDRTKEYVMLKDDTDEEDALYRLEFNSRPEASGPPVADREVWFDRQDLSIVRQKVYDAKGAIVSDTSYSKWKTFNGVPFPSHIDINRRMDEYGVVIEVLKMNMNTEIAPDKFELPQPEGARLRVIQ
jgi:outer membrane lipoprotein-sorting protein